MTEQIDEDGYAFDERFSITTVSILAVPVVFGETRKHFRYSYNCYRKTIRVSFADRKTTPAL